MKVHPARASTEDLQRSASELRADIDRTLTLLEQQLSPDRLLHSVSTQLRVGGIALALAAGRTVARHPKPTAAVGAAVLLYALVARGRRGKETHRNEVVPAPRSSRMHVAARVARGVMDAARVVNHLRRGMS